MKRVCIVGSGNVGANTAFFLAERGVADVVLADVLEGVSKGKALDIMEVAPLRSYRTRVSGSGAAGAIEGADVVVLAAGSARKPGMRREDLLESNEGVVRETAKLAGERAPGCSAVVVTEPIDLNTALFVAESGLPRERVMGVGGLLDSARIRYAVARDLDISVENVSALVLGRHGDEMLAPARFASVSGVPVLKLMPPDQFATIVDEARKAGDFIVDMAKRSSAYYAPSAAIAEVVDAIVRDTRRVLSVSALLGGEYDIEGVAMSLPAVVGEAGIVRFLLPALSDAELDALRRSADDMKALLERRGG